MFGSAAACEVAVSRVTQELFANPTDKTLHILKARMLRAAAQQYEKADELMQLLQKLTNESKEGLAVGELILNGLKRMPIS